MDEDIKSLNARKSFIFIIIFLALFGAIFVFVGSIVNSSALKTYDRCTVLVEATVIDFSKSVNEDTVSYTPIFSYIYHNEGYESHSNMYSSSFKKKYKVGDTYIIKINPDDPYEFYEEGISNSSRILGNIFRLVGLLILVLDVVIFIVKIIKTPTKTEY